MRQWWQRIGRWLSAACLLCAGSLAEAEPVHVGGAHFPPYVVKSSLQESRGLLPQLLEALRAKGELARIFSPYRIAVMPVAGDSSTAGYAGD